MMMAHGPWPRPYILWDQDKKEKSLLATRDPPREMVGSSPHTGGGGGGGSSSSGDEAEDPRRRAAIDSVVAAADFSTSLSKPPTKPISSPPQSHEANDEENKPKSHAFKLYQIKARPFFFLFLFLALSISGLKFVRGGKMLTFLHRTSWNLVLWGWNKSWEWYPSRNDLGIVFSIWKFEIASRCVLSDDHLSYVLDHKAFLQNVWIMKCTQVFCFSQSYLVLVVYLWI